jgi:hypothetical protein
MHAAVDGRRAHGEDECHLGGGRSVRAEDVVAHPSNVDSFCGYCQEQQVALALDCGEVLGPNPGDWPGGIRLQRPDREEMK